MIKINLHTSNLFILRLRHYNNCANFPYIAHVYKITRVLLVLCNLIQSCINIYYIKTIQW